MSIPLIKLVVEGIIQVAPWIWEGFQWTVKQLWGPVLQSIAGIAITLGLYIFFYWLYIAWTDTRIIRFVPFRVWGLKAESLSGEGIAALLRDELQRLQKEARTHDAIRKEKPQKESEQLTKIGVQFYTATVENLPPAEVQIHYQGISLDRINSYLRRRLFKREEFITGDVVVTNTHLEIATRGLKKGPWGSSTTNLTSASLKQTLEHIAVMIALELHPGNKENIGNVLTVRQRIASAMNDRQDAIRYGRMQIEAFNDARSYYNLGLAYQNYPHLQEAVKIYQKVLEKDPEHAPTYTNLGSVFAKLGNIDEAISHYNKALAIHPEDAIAYYNIGTLLSQEDMFDEAISNLQKAIEIDPADDAAHNNLGIIFGKQDKLDDAVRYFEKAIELNPNNAQAYNNLGHAFDNQKKPDEAITHYRKSIMIDPSDAGFYVNLGASLGEQGKDVEAITHYKKAIELDPNNAAAYFNFGNSLAKQGEFSDAITHYIKAIELKPDYAKAYRNLCHTLLLADRKQEAAEAFKKAKELDPTLEPPEELEDEEEN